MLVSCQSFLQAFVLGVLLAGCDAVTEYLPEMNGKSAAAEQKRLAKQKEETENRAQEDGERAALRQHITSSCKVLATALADSQRKSEAVESDRATLSACIRELSSSFGENGRTPERHVVLSGLLADDKINALALKYMERDFRMVRLEFVEAVRAANAISRRRDESLNRNQADYDKAMAKISDEANRSAKESLTAAAEIRKSIAALEKKEKSLQREVSMTSANRSVRSRKERELRDVSDRLRQLHRDYDEVSSSKGANESVQRATQQAAQNSARAQEFKARADAQVARTFSGMRGPAEITSEYEDRTVGELQRRIVAAASDVKAACSDIGSSLDYLKSAAVGLDKLNLTALQRVRTDVDARLSKKPVGR